MTITDLITALENAKGPDRALDLEIARAVAPDVIVLRHNSETGTNEPYTHWRYSGSIDAAVDLAEMVLPGWLNSSIKTGANEWAAYVWHIKNEHVCDFEVEDIRSTRAIALLIATLKAKESETP